jgi:hypothetical protein
MGMPETRYAHSGDVILAYQVLGGGPFDVVLAPGSVSHVELYWEAAGVAALLRGECDHLNWPRFGLVSSRISAPPGW